MTWFRNLKISYKLISGFFVGAVFTAGVGIFGIINIKTIDDLDTALYEENVIGISAINGAYADYMRLRVELAKAFIAAGKIWILM